MQFLVIEKISTEISNTPESVRAIPEIAHATNEYQQSLAKQGTLKAGWGLTDTPGAVYVIDVPNADELQRVFERSPDNMIGHTREVHPVTTLTASLTHTETAYRESVAQMDAMAKQQRR